MPLPSSEASEPRALRARGFSHIMKSSTFLTDMRRGYYECALWTEREEILKTIPELTVSVTSFDIDTLRRFNADCDEFIAKANEADIELADFEAGQLGHDFWLTRNGHGTGFWDRPEYWDERGDKLTAVAKSFPEASIYAGDDGKVHLL